MSEYCLFPCYEYHHIYFWSNISNVCREKSPNQLSRQQSFNTKIKLIVDFVKLAALDFEAVFNLNSVKFSSEIWNRILWFIADSSQWTRLSVNFNGKQTSEIIARMESVKKITNALMYNLSSYKRRLNLNTAIAMILL